MLLWGISLDWNGINLSYCKAICYHLHRMSMCSTWKAANDESGVRHSNKLLKNKSGKLISFFTTFQHYQQTWQLTHFNEPYSQNYLGQCWSTIRSLSNAADLFCERNFFQSRWFTSWQPQQNIEYIICKTRKERMVKTGWAFACVRVHELVRSECGCACASGCVEERGYRLLLPSACEIGLWMC